MVEISGNQAYWTQAHARVCEENKLELEIELEKNDNY